jgi:hypothetical protein
LNLIRKWPMERWAGKALGKVGLAQSRGTTNPALILLAAWAVEQPVDGAEAAAEVLESVADLAIAQGRAVDALASLLNLDDPETLVLPTLMDAETPQEIAEAMVGLLLASRAR